MSGVEGQAGPLHGLRVAVSEPWAVLRRGIVGVLAPHVRVVAEVADARQLPAVAKERPVELFLVGASADNDAAAVVADIVAAAPGAVVVVLFEEVDVSVLRAVLQAGARAALAKRSDDGELVAGLARVVKGERVVDQSYLPLLFGGESVGATAGSAPELLTARERDVLAQLARGASNREIAHALIVGESTVKTHLARIYAKLGVDDRHKAVRRALELGMLG